MADSAAVAPKQNDCIIIMIRLKQVEPVLQLYFNESMSFSLAVDYTRKKRKNEIRKLIRP